MKILRLIFLFTLLSSFSFSHHGVASLGTSGINGPGAPLETSTSFNIPKGKYLIYFKYDDVIFKKFTQERDDEKDFNNFLNFGIGLGATPYLSFYIFQPYNVKVKEDFSFNTAGFADLCLLGVFGFKYDEGFKLIPQEENLDDLKDFHFTIYSGMTIPSGDANLKNSEGEVEPDMSLGFGKPSFMLGFTTTKQISDKFTSSAEVSFTKFLENVYTDGGRYKFGDELRVNASLIYRIMTKPDKKMRGDVFYEGNFLYLKRDYENNEPLLGAGGKIFYSVSGIRFYLQNTSLGLGFKFPQFRSLNEEHLQQGCEGKEKIRIILTFSVLI